MAFSGLIRDRLAAFVQLEALNQGKAVSVSRAAKVGEPNYADSPYWGAGISKDATMTTTQVTVLSAWSKGTVPRVARMAKRIIERCLPIRPDSAKSRLHQHMNHQRNGRQATGCLGRHTYAVDKSFCIQGMGCPPFMRSLASKASTSDANE